LLRLDDKLAAFAPLQDQEVGLLACALPGGAGKLSVVTLPAAGYYYLLVESPPDDTALVILRQYANGDTPAAADLTLPLPGKDPAPLSIFRAKETTKPPLLYASENRLLVAVRLSRGSDTVLYLARVF